MSKQNIFSQLIFCNSESIGCSHSHGAWTVDEVLCVYSEKDNTTQRGYFIIVTHKFRLDIYQSFCLSIITHTQTVDNYASAIMTPIDTV